MQTGPATAPTAPVPLPIEYELAAVDQLGPALIAAAGLDPAALTIDRSYPDNVATLQKTYTDPEEWLKDIRQLRKDNKQEEADREWRRFLAAFPNHEVAETDAARAKQ